MAVLPSAERDTDPPWLAFPTAPEPTSLVPCCVQTPPLRVQTHAAPAATVVELPSDDGRVAVGGEGHGVALSSAPHGARADQLGALLGPDASAPRPDPRGPSVTVVAGALRRWPCCRRRRGTRSGLELRPPRRPSRPAWVPAGSRRLRSASRPTRPQRNRCRRTLRRWPCCRRRRGTRKCLVERSPRRPSPPTSALAVRTARGLGGQKAAWRRRGRSAQWDGAFSFSWEPSEPPS